MRKKQLALLQKQLLTPILLLLLLVQPLHLHLPCDRHRASSQPRPHPFLLLLLPHPQHRSIPLPLQQRPPKRTLLTGVIFQALQGLYALQIPSCVRCDELIYLCDGHASFSITSFVNSSGSSGATPSGDWVKFWAKSFDSWGSIYKVE